LPNRALETLIPHGSGFGEHSTLAALLSTLNGQHPGVLSGAEAALADDELTQLQSGTGYSAFQQALTQASTDQTNADGDAASGAMADEADAVSQDAAVIQQALYTWQADLSRISQLAWRP
jgi:hypothetical protein